MTSVEKRRSGRKSGRHRKHSKASSTGSFVDETDREVSNLTDRAFRSLCIGDEAVYNDSDLCSSSPCAQRDRQGAFTESGQESDRQDGERKDLKRAAHDSFSLRMQQYSQDWKHGGMFEAPVHRDPQWEVYGERTQVSATFQYSTLEALQQEECLRDNQLFLSNGAAELRTQPHRSRSRVSSLIRAFNSEGYVDGAGVDGKLREKNDETVWDKSALMSMQRDLSEFSTSYQQNLNSGNFHSAGPYSSNTSLYSSELAAVPHINSESSFMRSSHGKNSMSTQVNCNSNFFIHSEFSPFKVWKDCNRFPFQQGGVSGFLHCSEFSKWYETPMYNKLSLETQPQVLYRFEERGNRHSRNNLAPVVPPTLSHATSKPTIPQKALAVDKRCESELAGHYPHRKWTENMETNRLPSQRPSTASPTIEMSRRVQDTISSVKALQQKIKMMTEQNITTEAPFSSNNNLTPPGNGARAAPNVSSSNTSTTPFNITQLLTPFFHAHQEAKTAGVRQYAVSPQPVEHPPVRAESRGATPDVRMSSYKSRATNLLFNLKDNRKRVKSTYSPTKFKVLEIEERNKQHPIREPRDTVIDIPDFPDPDIQFAQLKESSRTNAVSHQNAISYHNPGLSTINSKSAKAHGGQYSEYTSGDYQPVQIQGEMVHHSGFTGFIPENCTSNQLANGQNLHEDLSSFTPYKQGMIDNVETQGGDVNRHKPDYTAPETLKLNTPNSESREYLINKANTEQHFHKTLGKEFTKVDRHQQLKDKKHNYSNVSSQDRRRQTNNQETENISLKTNISPRKQEITALMERDKHELAYERAAVIELHLPRDKYRGENQQSINKELEKIELRESFGDGTSHQDAGLVNPNILNQLPQNNPFINDSAENTSFYGQQQHGMNEDKYVLQEYNKQNKIKHNHQEFRDQQHFYSNNDKTIFMQETDQRKSIPIGNEMQSLQPIEAKPQLEQIMLKKSLSNSDYTSAPTMENQIKQRTFVEVKATAKHFKAQDAQEELTKPQRKAQVEMPKDRFILAKQTGSEKAKAEIKKHERVNHEKTEHIINKDMKEDQTKQSREKQSDPTREEHTKTEQTSVESLTNKPKNMTEETGVKHMRGVHCEQVKAEQAEAERLKEEHIKNEPTKTEQTRIKQLKTKDTRGEKLKAEQVYEEQVRDEELDREQVEAKQIITKEVKEEQAEAEHRKTKEANAEQINEKQAKKETEKTTAVEHDLIQEGQIKQQPKTHLCKAHTEKVEERQAEQDKLGQANMELAKAELANTDKMQERPAKSTAKVTETQLVKSVPDKVEQVKTELAKAKAELVKIKEKMRVEQKEKVRNSTNTKEDGIQKNVLLQVNNEDKSQDQGTQKYQQRQDSTVVSRQSTNQVNRGADDYEHLREKYGFTDIVSTNRNKLSAEAHVFLNENNETQALSLDKVETTNDEKSKDTQFPKNRFATTHRENKEKVFSDKPGEVTESHYVYSESSKEFKLSSDDYLPTNVDGANSETFTDEANVDSVRKLEKCDPLKHTHASQQRDSDLAKPLPHERKPKSSVHSIGPDSDPHLTPTRVLSHKERAQTKQEILTSKIKAHAEKEISAIKESCFAIRDVIISKTFTKQLAGIQRPEAQRPPSQEGSNKHESTMSSMAIPKHQIKPSRTQMEPAKSVSSPTSATMPVKSAAMTSQLNDHSQKKVAKEPLKSNAKDSNPPKEANQTGTDNMSTDESLAENQKKGNKNGNKAPIQSEEQAPTNKQGYQEAKNGETSGKQKKICEDKAALNSDHLNTKNEDSSEVTALVKAERSKNKTSEKAEKHEAVNEDSAPSLKLAFGQNETPMADDSLQIMGIMVTVRERKPSLNDGQSFQEQMNAKEKEGSNIEIDPCIPSSGLEVSKGNEYPKEVSRVKAKARDVQNTNPVEKEEQTNIVMNNNVENFQDTSALEIRKNTETDNTTVKWNELQQGSSATNASAQKETHKKKVQEPLAEKGMPSTVTVPAKNKLSAESETLLYKQVMIARETKGDTNKRAKENSTKIGEDELKSNSEEKNSAKMQTAHSNENITATIVNTEIDCLKDSNRVHAETHENQSSLKEDVAMVINPSSGMGKDSSILEEKRQDSTSLKPYSKTSPSNQLTGNENIQVDPKDQCKETQVGKNNQVENNVHIGSIAIRVVGKHATPVFSDVAAAHEPKQDGTSSHEEKENTLDNEDRTTNLTPVRSEKKDIFDDKLGNVLSSVEKLPDAFKISNKQSSKRTTIENTYANNGKPEKVSKTGKSADESDIQRMEGDYFEVQRVVETSHKPNSDANVGDTSAVSKRRDLSRLNKATISKESHNEGKNEVFALDQDKMKAMETSLVSVEDEIMARKNRETQGNLSSKQSDGPTEKQSNKNDKEDAGQSIHVTKQHTENQSSVSTKERQRERNPFPTMENMVRETPEVKPKPKERLSTIPEISAIADYARLKVIVSEDRQNTIQEFPRNKKEGFFPLIQSRHSRRPVFTADTVKEKSFPNKTEVMSKVNKEPKHIVFPITEKEHQRTGMFKLGDKERRERMPLDAKANEYECDTGVKHAHFKDRDNSPTTLKIPGREEQVIATNNQRVCQAEKRIHLSNKLPFQAAASSEINMARNTSVSQKLKQIDNTYSQDKPDECSSNTETKQVHKPEESKHTTQRTNVKTENAPANITEERPEKVRQERVPPQLKRSAAKQLGEESTPRIKMENRPEDMKIKQMIEESRASLAEEEKRTSQREEERRAQEQEAIAIQIKQKREKQREAERRAGERKAKQTEGEKAAQKEEKIRLKQQEAGKTMKETEEKRRIKTEEERRAKLREEEKQKMKNNKMRRRLEQQEEERVAQEEKQRRAVQEEEQLRRAVQVEEQQKSHAQEEQKRGAAQEEEQQRRAAQDELQRRVAQEVEQQMRTAQEQEQQRTHAQEEQKKRAAQEEQERITAQEEQQRRAAQEEKHRRAAQEELQRTDAREEQQRTDAREEQQRTAAQEEQQRRAAREEQQRRAAREEQQRRAAREEQQSRAAQEEQQRRAAQKEQQRRAAQEEQQRRAAQEEQQSRAVQVERQRRAAQEEQQRRAAQEEQQRRAAREEQQRRAAQDKEQQRRAAQEEQQRRAAQEEQQSRAAQEEQQRRAAQEEQQSRAAQEEQQRRAAQEEQQRRAAQDKEQQRWATQEKQQRAVLTEGQKAKQKILVDIEEGNKTQQREDGIYTQIITQTQEKAEHQIEEQKDERQNREVWMRTQKEEEEERRAVQKDKAITQHRGENIAKEKRNRIFEESQVALKEEREAQEQMFEQRQDEIRAKKREEEKEKLASYGEKARAAQMEEEKRGTQIVDALQYYTTASTEPERQPRQRQPCSDLPSPQRNNSSAPESTDISHTRLYRSHAASSPAPSLPRSNTSSPALGAKPSMFRVKDNTIRGSSFIKSVKPRFHKTFGEDFRVGSPMGSERVDEEQDTMRHSVVTPLHLDTGFNRLTTIKESSTSQPAYSSQDYTAPLPHHRPYSRRSIALEDDDARSVISNMSEDVESFATSAADLADVRGLYDYERPESSCSFSSDVCRSLGKPPAVPPKSEKALRRAKRLTTLRIKKELSKAGADSAAGVEKPLLEGSSFPSSSSTEVRSSGRHAVATPHFSPPVSLARAPKLESGLPSSQTEPHSSRSSFYASPHATGPISLPNASPYVAASVSFSAASPHATGPASHVAAPKTIADVPSSPTLHHASTPAPVTKYHVESSYPHSYPLTQRKVLQDLGSGQYFVVDVPVQVKAKTFFDPEMGKYVQLNVHESSKRSSQPQLQQIYLQPQLQPQIHIKPQQQPPTQEAPASKPVVLQGYPSYPQSYQPVGINSVPHSISSAPVTLEQDQQSLRESHSYGYPATEIGQNSEEHYYSPEKAPYMDTVNDTNKTHNTVYNTHSPYESFPECNTNSQLAGSSPHENDNSAHSQCRPCDIITMSELEDFMELSDW